MTLLLNLDKTEYYKNEYTDKILLNGIISDMDSNKQYCIYFSYIGSSLANVHNNTYDYTYLTNRTNSNLSGYGAYIPLSELSFDNNGIADIIVQVNVVDGSCSRINWEELDSFVNIIVYNYDKPITTKNTELSIFVSKNEAILNESIFIEGYLKTEEGYPIHNARIDFYDKDIGIDQKLKENNNDIYAYTAPDGSYVGFWPAQLMDILDKTIEIYTKFEGDSNFNKSESEIKILNIIIEEPILTAEIGTITYEINEQIGEDEITFTIPIKNTSKDTIYNYIKLFDTAGNEIEKEPDTYKYVESNGTINIILSSKYKTWSIEDVQGQEVMFKLYSSFSALSGYDEVDSIIFNVEPYSEDKILTAEIGTVTYEINEQIGEDEITFTIPIKNTSKDTIYNYIKLFDAAGNEIEKEPDVLPKKISGGEVENIILSSKYKTWSIEDVQGQEVMFKLYSDFSSFTKLENYGEIDLKSFDVESYSEDKITPKLTIILNTTTAVSGDEIRISGMLITKEGIPLQFGRVWIYATGDIIKNFLMDESDVVLYADTDNNGIYQINWIAKQMDKDETIELIAMTKSDDSYNAVQSIPITITLTDVEEKLEEQKECFIDNPFYPLKSDNPCLISDTQATWIKYGAIGIVGLYVFSTVAPIIKGVGKVFEKKMEK